MKKIEIADGLTLPENAAVQVYAFMGRRGSGRTFGAGRLVEQVIGAGGQVVILDPVGTWYGLRLASDGKSPGLPIPVFGGLHGDIPLEATAGKVVAELASDRGTSLVLDVSSFTGADQRRFVADFATEFFQAKKSHRSAVLVVMEEAQEFAPQHVSKDSARMVGAVERMIKLGRNFGIGTVLVSQRPQAVNKDVLNQTEAMFCFQMTGPQERKTIEGWVQEKGAGGRDVGDQLPGLPVGTALMWSPQWLGKFGKFRIFRKATYDASATPEAGEAASAALAPIDLEVVRGAMAATVEKSRASDPKVLQARIAELEREAKKKAITTCNHAPGIEKELSQWKACAEARGNVIDDVKKQLGLAMSTASNIAVRVTPTAPRAPRSFPVNPDGHRSMTLEDFNRTITFSIDNENGGQMRMLRALAGTRKDGLSRREIGALADVKSTGGTFGTYLSRLRGEGLIESGGYGFRITEAGRAKAGYVEQPTGRALLEWWKPKLGDKPARMLETIVDAPEPLSRDYIAESCGLAGNAGTFGTYLSRLISRGLVERAGRGMFRAADVFRE